MLITPFNLDSFHDLIPLLMRCFPDFWEPRLAQGKYSFPYDLHLFTAHLDGKIIGCIGIHEYRFYLDGAFCSCGGLSDVAVDPDHRGKGYALQLQEFALEYCRSCYTSCSLLPLYTDKPGVYTRLGWKIYESKVSQKIPSADFPPEDTLQFDASTLDISCLEGSKTPVNREEKMALRIMEIYRKGSVFNGKCFRSPKTWHELFTDSSHFWHLDNESFCLYRNKTLLEAYSENPGHRGSSYTVLHGGHDDNKVMVNLPRQNCAADKTLLKVLEEGSFIFPAADVF